MVLSGLTKFKTLRRPIITLTLVKHIRCHPYSRENRAIMYR